jgi:hypothetical protein
MTWLWWRSVLLFTFSVFIMLRALPRPASFCPLCWGCHNIDSDIIISSLQKLRRSKFAATSSTLHFVLFW